MTKYNAKKVTIDGITFASQLEGERFKQLMLLQKAGEITDLQLQPELQIFEGYVNCYDGVKHRSRFYVGDFKYLDLKTQQWIIEDTKGLETPEFRLKWEYVQSEYQQYVFRKVTRDMV